MLLKAGPVEMLYENGFLRYLRVGEEEVVRMLYFAIRDQDWNTLPGRIQDETISSNKDSFAIQYTCVVDLNPVRFQWQVYIKGSEDGSIQFTIKGKALGTFLKNRSGFCVLHPIENLKGQPCRIEHPDGTFSQWIFPEYVSPHQPFKNIRAMEWSFGGNATASLEFAGDIFETEDQRNWTDASYKTYCTPLELPYPVEIVAGTEIHQSITFKINGPLPATEVNARNEITVRAINELKVFPLVGIGTQAEGIMPTEPEINFFRKSSFSFLRSDVFLSQTDWFQKLAKAFQHSEQLQIPLELAVFFESKMESELSSLLQALAGKENVIDSIIIFEERSRRTTNQLISSTVSTLRKALPQAKVGGGTDGYFADFNRNSFSYGIVDFVSFSINPQVHAFDNLSLIENMAAQRDVVESAKHLTKDKPVHASPVTLKPRFNPDATSGHIVSVPYDDRQSTAFAAAWTLGSVKYLAEAGSAAITYFETTGPRGIVAGDEIFPVGKLLHYILQWQPQKVQPTLCSVPLKVSSLLLQKDKESCLLLANHSGEDLEVHLPNNFTSTHIHPIVSQRKHFEMLSGVLKSILLLPNEILALHTVHFIPHQ